SSELKNEIAAAVALEDVSGLATTQDVAAAGDLMAEIQDLKTATADASKAVASADAAVQLQSQLPIFTETATRTIADPVAAKISQLDSYFSKLSASRPPRWSFVDGIHAGGSHVHGLDEPADRIAGSDRHRQDIESPIGCTGGHEPNG